MILLPWSPRKLPHTAESQSRSRWSSMCNRWNLWADGDDQGPSRSRLNIYEISHLSIMILLTVGSKASLILIKCFVKEAMRVASSLLSPQYHNWIRIVKIKQGFKSPYFVLGIHATIFWQEVVVGERVCWGSLDLHWYEAEKSCPSHPCIVQHSGWGRPQDSGSCYIPTWQ